MPPPPTTMPFASQHTTIATDPPKYSKSTPVPGQNKTLTLKAQLESLSTRNTLPSLMFSIFDGSFQDVYNRLRDTHNSVDTKNTLFKIAIGVSFSVTGLFILILIASLWWYHGKSVSVKIQIKCSLSVFLLWGAALTVFVLSLDCFSKIGEKRRDVIANVLKEITDKDVSNANNAKVASITGFYAAYMSVCLRGNVRQRLNNDIANFLRRGADFEHSLMNVYAILKFLTEEHVFYTNFELLLFDNDVSTNVTYILAAAAALIIFFFPDMDAFHTQDVIVMIIICVMTVFSILPMFLTQNEKHSFPSQVSEFLQKYESFNQWPVNGDNVVAMDMDVRKLCSKMPYSKVIKPEWLSGLTITTAVCIMALSVSALLYMIMGHDQALVTQYTLAVGALTVIIVPCMLFCTNYFL